MSQPQPSTSGAPATTRLRRTSDASSGNAHDVGTPPEPPDYPPDGQANIPPPTYHSRPNADENTLLAGSIPSPEGVLTHSAKLFTVALTRQNDHRRRLNEMAPADESRPIYGRGGHVSGVLEIKTEAGLKLSDILSVDMQVLGKIKLDISEGGSSSYAFLDYTTSLFPSTASGSKCPSMLTFGYSLPTTYQERFTPQDDPAERALPPTYEAFYDGVPGLHAQVKYSMRFNIHRKRIWKLTQKHSLSIPFDYVPRSRPPVPGPDPTASFAAALKQSPEEWAVFVNDVPRREAPTLASRPVHYAMDTALQSGETITSSFVLPCTQTFPLGQAIPFHLQLSLSTQFQLQSTPPTTTSSPPISSPLFPRRPKTTSGRAPSTSRSRHSSRNVSPTRVNLRPATAPASSTQTLLSLFSNPTFGPPPRGRRRPLTAIVGLGEGIAGDGAMAFGDPRDRNMGRHPGGITVELNGQRFMDDVAEEDVVLADNIARGRGAGTRPLSGSGSTGPRRSRPPIRGPGGAPATAGVMAETLRPSLVQKNENVSYIRVFLQRQIVVTVKGQKVVKTIACGDGKLHRITLDNPPTFSDLHSEQQAINALDRGDFGQTGSNLLSPPMTMHRRSRSLSPALRPREGLEYIAWEGHVLPSKDLISVGGFRATGLWVKDFITLTMVPPNPEESPLRALHHAVPVRLVSDPWEEEWWTMDRRA